jgi:UDP-N-acetyl-D-mannosaminuronate dehydrogenase
MAQDMEAVGIIGVGRMGLPVCATLARKGFTVTASDVRPEARKAVLACGARWGYGPADGELLPVAMMEEQAGVHLRRGPS